jgi:hypothetical protein
MSLDALTWASQQATGSPSAKVTLFAIANYCNPATWCGYPGQDKIAEITEQSLDSVQRRITELEAKGLLRRIPLRHRGRRSVDFFIVEPSPYYRAPLAEIRPLVPRGFEIDPRFAASADEQLETLPAAGSTVAIAPDAVATPSQPQIAATSTQPHTLPQTLPQTAVDAAATVRQPIEPIEPMNRGMEREARARGGQQGGASSTAGELSAEAALEALRLTWPNMALENKGLALSALDRMTPAERQAAVDRVPAFLAFHKENRGKRPLPYLHLYLAERRFADLPEPTRAATAAGGGAGSVATYTPAFTRLWWLLFHRAAAGLVGASSERQAAILQGLRKRISLAKSSGIGWTINASEDVGRYTAQAEQLAKAHVDGEPVAQWRQHYRELGVDMPLPDQVAWIFVPAELPALQGGN